MTATSLPETEFARIPFLRVDALHGRVVPLSAWWDGSGWHTWVVQGERLVELKPVGAVKTSYFAKEPAGRTDLFIPFHSYIWKHASWPDVMAWAGTIVSDVHNLAASLGKIDVLWTGRILAGDQLDGFVKTELEYVLVVCRSLLDHLQEVSRAMWTRVRLLDDAAQKRKRELPSSFRAMVLENNQFMNAARIGQRHAIPLPLAEFYEQAGQFLELVRRWRDGIVHHGRDATDAIFIAPRGFAISKQDPFFASLGVLTDAHADNEQLWSLRPALAYLSLTPLYICNALVEAMGRVVTFPPDLAPDHAVYVRSTHGEALVRAQEVLNGGYPWWPVGNSGSASEESG